MPVTSVLSLLSSFLVHQGVGPSRGNLPENHRVTDLSKFDSYLTDDEKAFVERLRKVCDVWVKSNAGEGGEMVPPDELNQNMSLREITTLSYGESKAQENECEEMIQVALDLLSSRSCHPSMNLTDQLRRTSNDWMVPFTRHYAKSSIIKDLMRSVSIETRENLESLKRSWFEEPPPGTFKRRRSGSITLTYYGPFRILRCDIKTKKKMFILNSEGLKRLISYHRSIASVACSLSFEKIRVSIESAIEILEDAIYMAGEYGVSRSGEMIKAVRTTTLASMEEREATGVRPEVLIMSEYDRVKAGTLSRLASLFRSVFCTKEQIINYTNIFKATFHPDISLFKAHMNLQGIKKPNKVDPAAIAAIDGEMRRTLFFSAHKSKIVLRPRDDSEHSELYHSLMKSGLRMEELRKYAVSDWSRIRFEVHHELAAFSRIPLRASNKSSAEETRQTYEEVSSVSESINMKLVKPTAKGVTHDFRTVNDLASELSGISNLKFEKGIFALEKAIRIHTAFESKYPGVEPEDIPLEDFEKFCADNCENLFPVHTEPKFGEKHKEVTRTFYMAIQKIKAVTQTVERLVRQLIRSQPGISITKTSANRKNDMITMLDSMKRAPEGFESWFLSFDISEFSKKFPNKLLRLYGAILAEVTGCNALSRLDIIFRNSIVISSSRGELRFLLGVGGGFEGFFNFLWTSIHEIIMKIAQREAGVSGVLLTFSDDGLLNLFIREDTSDQKRIEIFNRIRDTYSKFGLKFNWGKTLAGMQTFEYLGELARGGRLLPQFVKELCSFGEWEPSTGFNSRAQRIRSLEGQARALVKAGCHTSISSFLLGFWSSVAIRDTEPSVKTDMITTLLVIPWWAGGLRIPGPYEISYASDLESFAYFIADMINIMRLEGTKCRIILREILANLKKGDGPINALIAGNRVSTTLADTSGMSIENSLVNEVTGSKDMGPYSRETIECLRVAASSIMDLNPAVFSAVISRSPQAQEYAESMALVRSKGAHKLLDAKTIKAAQKRDTENVRKGISFWREVLFEMDGHGPSPIEFSDIISRRYLSDYRICKLRLPPHCVVTFNSEVPHILVTVDFSSGDRSHLSELPYSEHPGQSSNTTPLITAHSEFTQSKKDSYRMKFISALATLMHRDPDLFVVADLIARAFGVVIPPLPNFVKNSAARIRAGFKMKPNVVIFGPPMPIARSKVRVLTDLKRIYSVNITADRSTYPEGCRMIACIHSLIDQGFKVSQRTTVLSYMFGFAGDMSLLFTPKPQSPLITRIPDLQFPEAKDSYTYEEETRLLSDYRSMDSMASYNLVVLQPSIAEGVILPRESISKELIGIYSEDLSNFLHRILSASVYVSDVPVIHMPYSLTTFPNITRLGIVKAVYKTLSSDYKMRESMQALSVGRIKRRELEQLKARVSGTISKLIESLSRNSLEELGVEMFQEAFERIDQTIMRLKDHVDSISLFSNSRAPIIVKARDDRERPMATSQRIGVARSAFALAIQRINIECNAVGWDEGEIRELFKGERDMNSLLLYIRVAHKVFRPSEKHRTASWLYNSKTLYIRIAQILYVSFSAMEIKGAVEAVLATNDTEGKRFFEEKEMRYLELAITRQGREELGPDHSRFIRQGIPAWGMPILKKYLRYNNVRSRYKPRSFQLMADCVRIARDLQTIYYQKFLSGHMDRVRCISPSVQSLAINNLEEVGAEPRLLTPSDYKIGSPYIVPVRSDFRPGLRYPIAFLCHYCDKFGIPSVRVSPDIDRKKRDRLVSLIYANMIGDEESKFEFTMGVPGDTQIGYVEYYTESPTSACAYQLYFSDNFHSNVMVVREGEGYILAGCISSMTIPWIGEAGHESFERFNKLLLGSKKLGPSRVSEGVTVEDIVLPSIASAVESISIDLRIVTSLGQTKAPDRRRRLVIVGEAGTNIDRIRGAKPPLKGCMALSAAHTLMRGDRTSEKAIQALALVLVAFTGVEEEKNAIIEAHRSMLVAMAESAEGRHRRLMTQYWTKAAGSIGTWLTCVRMEVSLQEFDSVSSIVESCRTHEVDRSWRVNFRLPGIANSPEYVAAQAVMTQVNVDAIITGNFDIETIFYQEVDIGEDVASTMSMIGFHMG